MILSSPIVDVNLRKLNQMHKLSFSKKKKRLKDFPFDFDVMS